MLSSAGQAPQRRALPTPCRTTRPGPRLVCSPQQHADRCTLLELANRDGIADVLNRAMLHPAPLCRRNFVEQVPISHQSFPAQPLRFGTLDLNFTPGDISTLLCSPATLAGFGQALEVCPIEDRSWFLQRAYDLQLHAFQGLTCFTDGSFTPESASKPATVGWACAFFDPNSAQSDAFRCCVGVASGSMPDLGSSW